MDDDKNRNESMTESTTETEVATSTPKAGKSSSGKKNTEGPNWFVRTYRTYKAEYKKIVWPTRATMIKHTITVIAVSLLFGAYIALTDGILNTLFSQFVRLIG